MNTIIIINTLGLLFLFWLIQRAQKATAQEISDIYHSADVARKHHLAGLDVETSDSGTGENHNG